MILVFFENEKKNETCDARNQGTCFLCASYRSGRMQAGNDCNTMLLKCLSIYYY